MAASVPYASATEAGVYFGERPGSTAWTAASSDDKLKALQAATRAINRQLYKGVKLYPTEVNAFPRILDYLTQSEVPVEVKEACCEEAIAILGQYDTPRLNMQQQGVASASFAGSSVSFRPGAGKGLLSQTARELLRPFMLGPV